MHHVPMLLHARSGLERRRARTRSLRSWHSCAIVRYWEGLACVRVSTGRVGGRGVGTRHMTRASGTANRRGGAEREGMGTEHAKFRLLRSKE